MTHDEAIPPSDRHAPAAAETSPDDAGRRGADPSPGDPSPSPGDPSPSPGDPSADDADRNEAATGETARGDRAHLRRLWRHRGTTLPTPRRGPQQQLDLDEILDAAIVLADAEGLPAVSTRAVAARFDKTAMALYPYVGSKEQLLALMQDHACALPPWNDPGTTLAAGLEAWALAFFEVHLAHPWLAALSWAESAQGPNERDWLERLLTVLSRWATPLDSRTPAVTMLYATVRACAETAAAYRRLTADGAARWRANAEATRDLLPDLPARYPLTVALPPVTTPWQDAPRAGLIAATRLLAAALTPS